MEASFFHYFLLHPTVTLSANPAGLSPKIYPQTSPVSDYTAVQNCCHIPLHYYTHLFTTLFAYAFVLIKSMVHRVVGVIILKTKTATSLLSAQPSNGPILLKIKIQRPDSDLALPPPVYQLFVTSWTVARQVPLSLGFSRQEYWNGSPCLPIEEIDRA